MTAGCQSQRRVGVVASLALIIASFGCNDGVRLGIVAHTDIGASEIATIRTDLGSAPFETNRFELSYEPTMADDLLTGVEIASFLSIPGDDYFVTVALVDHSGQTVATREMTVRIDEDLELTVPVDRACIATTCPESGGPADRTSCTGGNCVNPFCSSAFREACESSCAADAECPAATPCVESRCVEGVCLFSDRNC